MLISHYTVYYTGSLQLVVLKLDDLCIGVLSFRRGKIVISLVPTQLLTILIYVAIFLFGFIQISNTECYQFCISVVLFLPNCFSGCASVRCNYVFFIFCLMCWTWPFGQTFVLFFRSLFAVLLPISMVHSFSVAFSIGLFVPKVSVKSWPCILLHRGTTSVLSCFPVVLAVILLPLFLHSAWFRFRQFRVPAVLFGSWRFQTFFYLLGIPPFPIYWERWTIFFSWSCILPPVTKSMSYNQAGVLYSSVRSIFVWNIVDISASGKPRFWIGSIRWNFLRLMRIHIVSLFLPIISFGRMHNPGLFWIWTIVLSGRV